MIELYRNNSGRSELQTYKVRESSGEISHLRKCAYTRHGINLIQSELSGWEWYKKSHVLANEIQIEHHASGASYEHINISWAEGFQKRKYFCDLFENKDIIQKTVRHYCEIWPDSPKCALHGDFSVDNVLFKGNRLLIIDWEHFTDKQKVPWGFDLVHFFFESMWFSMKCSHRTRARLRDIRWTAKLFEEITKDNPHFTYWKSAPLSKLTEFMWENQNLWGNVIKDHPEKFPVLQFSKWQIENIDSFLKTR